MGRPLVLIADDDPLVVALLTDRLIHSGYHVISAENGREAVDMAQAHCPAVAIFDVDMPGFSGLQALLTLRAREHALPTIILTAGRRPEDLIDAVHAGAAIFKVKPFDCDDIILQVDTLVARNRRSS